jgi:hypothetical protein
MNLFSRMALFVLAGLLLLSCSDAYYKTYYSEDAYLMAQAERTIAVVPSAVYFESTAKGTLLQKQYYMKSLNIQQEIYRGLQKWELQGNALPKVQDLAITNSKLEKVLKSGDNLSSFELCRLLGVDGIVTSEVFLSQSISDGALLSDMPLTSFLTSKNVSVLVGIYLYPCRKVIWSYSRNYSGSIGHTTLTRVINHLMQAACHHLPYKKREFRSIATIN